MNILRIPCGRISSNIFVVVVVFLAYVVLLLDGLFDVVFLHLFTIDGL